MLKKEIEQKWEEEVQKRSQKDSDAERRRSYKRIQDEG